jgi:hypothetical protein
MRDRWSIWLPVALAGLVDRASAANTFEMAWSDGTYGPDGPWQAVSVRIGSNNALVNLYPGGTWGSHILSPSICNNSTLSSICYAQVAGLYDPTLSSTSAFGDVDVFASVDFTNGALQLQGSKPITGIDNWNISNSEAMFPQDINMALHESIWATLPDGSTYPLTVGSLALGAPNTINQTFGFGNGIPAFNATLLPGYLSAEADSNKIISSNSYGLHIGSVDPPIAPSLYFGGFDQNRALGTVSTQQGSPDSAGAIDLLDIKLSVNSGASPWSFNSLGGLLSSGNDTIKSQLPVAINSLAPYLHLPKSTCDAIAKNLPVTYQAKYGLYFWNTDDPKYQKIVSSPSSLGFTFRASESSKNMTIDVPFSLLNLTLTAPLTNTPTSYFPCKAETQGQYQLGRAFLQAAFIGVNWDAFNGSAAWWLAQAPGPTTPTQVNIQAIGNEDTTIPASQVDWASTWADTWTPLSDSAGAQTGTSTGTGSSPTNSAGSNGDGTNKSTSSGLSTGAKAGIGVACGIVGLALIIGAIMFFVRRGQNHTDPITPIAEAPAHSQQPPEMQGGYAAGHTTYYDPPKPPGQQHMAAHEMYSGEQRYELHTPTA